MKTLTPEQVLEKMLANVRNGNDIYDGIEGEHHGRWHIPPDSLGIRSITNGSVKFRLAPRTRNICGFDVPAPDTYTPKRGTKYYCFNPHRNDGISCVKWDGVAEDTNALRNGLWLNEEDALANAKALRGENPYN